jgi:hypothetical protein
MTSRNTTCLACGGRIAPSLTVGASLRCHDCRDGHAPLRADLVEPSATVVGLARPAPAQELRTAA